MNGRKLTAFTNEEEIAYKKDKLTPFFLEDALKEKGAFFMEDEVGTINVIEDDNLITGQNFQSSEQFAQTVIKHLKAKDE